MGAKGGAFAGAHACGSPYICADLDGVPAWIPARHARLAHVCICTCMGLQMPLIAGIVFLYKGKGKGGGV